MADPYGNYQAGLSFLGGPELNPGGLSPEQQAALGLSKVFPAPGIGVEAYPITERGLASLQNMSDLGRYAMGDTAPDSVPQSQLAEKAMKAIMDINNVRMPGAEPNTAGSFGGKLAQGWSPAAAEKYQGMLREGYTPQDAFRETGMFRTADKKLKFEIPDTVSSLTNAATSQLLQIGRPIEGRLGDFLNHPQLYENYPQMRDLPTTIELTLPRPTGAVNYEGTYDPAGSITASSSYLEGPNGIHSVLLHEGTHHIQGLEDFARGSSPSYEMEMGKYFLDRLNYEHNVEMLKPNPDMNKIARIKTLSQEFSQNFKPYDAYHRSAGEVDARAVQERMGMTPWDLSQISPADTAAGLVPFNRQIVRFE